MNILCIGGAGYIGSACVRYMYNNGHQVRAYDNLSQGNRRSVPYDRLLINDLYSRTDLKELIRHFKIDTVMHFAAHACVPESVKRPEKYYGLNVGGTKALLDTLVQTDVQKIIFSSSCSVYGDQRTMTGHLHEDTPVNPVTPYGRSKVICEWMLEDYRQRYGLGYTSLRYFNAAGAELDGSHGEWRKNEFHLVPLILNALRDGTDFKIFGDDYPTLDGTCVRDYVHIRDLAKAHLLAAEALLPHEGKIYNLGSGKGSSILEVIKQCEKTTGRLLNYQVDERRPGDPPFLFASSNKVRNELGWEPRHGLEDIVKSAWKWHNNFPQTY